MLGQIIKSIIKRNEPAIIPAQGTSVVRQRVWPHQIDYNLHMNNAKYLNVLEGARWTLFRDNGWFKHLFEKRINLVVASLEITFIRELNLFSGYEIHTKLLTWDKKYIYFEHRLMVKGKLYGHALVKMAGVRKGKRALTPEICEAVGADFNQADIKEAITHWSDMTQAKREL
ncbi:thioesterase family protein [Thalassolituus sp. UBA2590]|uniref:thioesterase family protein n=1 Tax=Thalassolituus sp. UBA2590 TaxID=1947663 RepID=UPI0026476C0A|nr:thioesterase family protein [Thalassolituus sp. UBA2590]|tara:strand:+ start:1935 stop:2450 length:516 start_codon:yes stop_codon:yes gene_type:complete